MQVHLSNYAYTEQCVFLILYIHSIYGILYMYITKYGCVFLKLGESIYVAMDLIPILLGSLPLAHNAPHSESHVLRCTVNDLCNQRLNTYILSHLY